MIVVLLLALTAWALARKYAPRSSYTPAAAIVSPAEIERRAKAAEKAAREAEKAEKQRQHEEEKARKAEQAKQQAAADEKFFIEQIDKLYKMLWDADSELKAARATCQHDNEMNRNGAVIPEKRAAKHRADRDKLERKVMQLERNIHSYEAKLTKAQQIAQN